MRTWTVTLCLNSQHSVSFPCKVSFVVEQEKMINWPYFKQDSIKRILNKFRKQRIGKKNIIVFTQNGSVLNQTDAIDSSLAMAKRQITNVDSDDDDDDDSKEEENERYTVSLSQLKDEYIYDGCVFYIARKGESFSLDLNVNMKNRKNVKDKSEEKDCLLIQTLPKKSNKLIGAVIGLRGGNLRNIVGSCNISGALLIEEEKPHRKSKGKEFEQVELQWNKNYIFNNNQIDPQSLIYNELINVDPQNGKLINTSKKDTNKPVIVLRGNKENVLQAKRKLDLVINNSDLHEGYWINLLNVSINNSRKKSGKSRNTGNKVNAGKVVRLARHFVRMEGVSKSWYIGDKKKLNQLTITRHIIDDTIPKGVIFPLLYIRCSLEALNSITNTLVQRCVQFERVVPNENGNDNDNDSGAENGDENYNESDDDSDEQDQQIDSTYFSIKYI